MPKILIIDPLDETVKQHFAEEWGSKRGYTLIYNPSLKAEHLAKELAEGEYDALIVGSKDVSAEALTAWRSANKEKPLVVVRAGSDYSHIALGAAVENNILVMNTPGANKEVITKYICERLPEDGRGKKLAIIGYGAIGKEVATEAHKRKFAVTVFSPHLTETPADGSFTTMFSPGDALKDADYVSVTVPLISREEAERVNSAARKRVIFPSFHLIDQEVLRGLNDGAHIILPSRPEVLDMGAVAEAIYGKKVGKLHVNTTVDDIEALRREHGLLFSSGDILPSAKFLTVDAKRSMAVAAFERVVSFFENGLIKSPVIPVSALSHSLQILAERNKDGTLRSRL